MLRYSLLEHSLPPLRVTETVTTDVDGQEHTTRREEGVCDRSLGVEVLLYPAHNVLLLVAHLLGALDTSAVQTTRHAVLAQVLLWFSYLGTGSPGPRRLSRAQCAVLDMVLARQMGGDLLRLLSQNAEGGGEQGLLQEYLSREHFDALLLQFAAEHSNLLGVTVSAGGTRADGATKALNCIAGSRVGSGEVASFDAAPLSLAGVALSFSPRVEQ